MEASEIVQGDKHRMGGTVLPSKIVDCPVCGSAMQKRMVNNGIELDFCDWHGIWLDAGELERLLAANGS